MLRGYRSIRTSGSSVHAPIRLPHTLESPSMDDTLLQEWGENYTAAWCSQNAARSVEGGVR
jgi:hypothetical protein